MSDTNIDTLVERIDFIGQLETVAESHSFDDTSVTHFTPRMGIPRTYALTAVIQDGINQIESFPVNPIILTCDKYGAVILNTANPTGERLYIDFLTDIGGIPTDNDTLYDDWGDTDLPTVVLGGLDYDVVTTTATLVDDDNKSAREKYQILRALKRPSEDRTPIIVCLRDDDGNRITGKLDKADWKRADAFGVYTVSLAIVQTEQD